MIVITDSMKTLGYWIEAMRLRTLPVSVAGVLAAAAYALLHGVFNPTPAVICLIFAVMAQIASNFANEYFDYTAGRDRPGREGPRRGVTEGEITPQAMKKAVYITLGLAGCFGLSLVAWGGWWLLAVGAFIAVGVFAYSAGPYPLSTNGLGEVAVIFFFGIIPVNLTYYVQAHAFAFDVFLASVAIGLMGANVLIINNYRDTDDDRAVGKRTLSVRYGQPAMRRLYLADAIAAAVLLLYAWIAAGPWSAAVPLAYLLLSAKVTAGMSRRSGAALTPLLGATSMLMFGVALALLIIFAIR